MEKMNFIKANNKFINLEHVSSINVLQKRVAFDLDCPVELDNKVISYYAYSDSDNREDFKTNNYIQCNFINKDGVYINRNHISAVTFRDDKNRIIFNLSHSITSTKHNGESRLTSKFIYFDFNTINEYNKFIIELTNILQLKTK